MVGSKLVSKLVSRTLEKYFSWLKNFMATKIKMVGSKLVSGKVFLLAQDFYGEQNKNGWLNQKQKEKYFSWLKNFMAKKKKKLA